MRWTADCGARGTTARGGGAAAATRDGGVEKGSRAASGRGAPSPPPSGGVRGGAQGAFRPRPPDGGRACLRRRRGAQSRQRGCALGHSRRHWWTRSCDDGQKWRSSGSIRRHCSALSEDEVTVVDGVPVTIVPRTIFDLAAAGTIDGVENLIRESEYRQLHDRLSLPALLERYPRRRGAPRVRAALERIEGLPVGRPKSPLEERFLPFLSRYGLPRPRLNEWIALGDRRYQVDCHWPGTGQIVELDSWEGHGTRSAFRRDRDEGSTPAGGRLLGDPRLLGAAGRRTRGRRRRFATPP